MSYSTPQQLCFPPIAGYTIRADFEGGALSSDFGALLLRGIDRQIGLTERLAAAMQDKRHPSYIDHPLRDLLAQRIYQIASGYADGNDANNLRHDPLFKLSVERPRWRPRRTWRVPPPFRVLNTAWTARTSTASPTRWSTTASPATPSHPPPLCSTSITPMTRPMASRNSRSITTTIGVIAICRCSFSKGPHAPW